MPRSAPPAPAAPSATGGYKHVDLITGALPCPVNKILITHTSWAGDASGGRPVTLITDLRASHSLDGPAGGVPSCAYYCYFNYQYTFQITACAVGGSPCSPWGPTLRQPVGIRDLPRQASGTSIGPELACIRFTQVTNRMQRLPLAAPRRPPRLPSRRTAREAASRGCRATPAAATARSETQPIRVHAPAPRRPAR